jgi:small-conductance mechanosensitive channel
MTYIRDLIEAAPDWLIGVALLLVAATAAAVIYSVIARLLLKVLNGRSDFILMLFKRARRLIGLFVVLMALSITAQLPYFPDNISDATSHALSTIAILLAGWAAIIATGIASDLYLRRFNISAADNLLARKHVTQVAILRRAVKVLIIILTAAVALMAFDSVRQFGVSLFASAGAAGLIVGLAARPVLSNLIAGIQLAVTQPIRIDDVVVIEGEYGVVEEISSTYVVVKIWDLRRLIVPLSYFMEKHFENWTRESSDIIGSVYLQTDYNVPVEKIRAKLKEIVESSDLWDRKVLSLQVTDCKESTVEPRVLVSAAHASQAWDLRCQVREKLLDYLRSEFPGSLPRQRVDLSSSGANSNPRVPAAMVTQLTQVDQSGADQSGASQSPARQTAAE